MKRNRTGFGVVEGLLILVIIGILGFTGWYVWHSKNATDKTLNSASSTSQSATATTSKGLIIAAVKRYSGAGSSQQDATVTIDSIQGNNAEGRVTTGTNADNGISAQFIAHKGSTGWQVIYEGQQAPGSDIGTKYNLPASWYTQ